MVEKQITVTEFAIHQLEEVRRLEASHNGQPLTEEWANAVDAAEKALKLWLHERKTIFDDIEKAERAAAAKAGK
jgi:hypothetical protein